MFLRIAVVVGGLGWGILWLSREQRWSTLRDIFLQMNLWVFAAVFAVFMASQLIIGLRWWLLLRSQSIFIGFWAVVRLYLLGWFYNNFMPGSVGGDLLRAWYVTRHTDKKFEAVLSVFVDRVIGLSSTLVIAVFFYLLFLRGKSVAIASGETEGGGLLASVMAYKGVLLWAGVILAVAICVLLLFRRSRAELTRAWSQLRVHGVRTIVRLKDSAVLYCRRPLTILLAFALTVALQLMVITGFWFLGSNLGIQAGIKYYYVFFTLAWVLGAIPVSIGGAVVVEVLLASLFIRYAGVSEEAASALALCQRAVWMLASLPGAAIHLMGAHLPKDFFIDYDKPVA
ncbi:MAG: lysylphosphatidylglycerol synthase transmembrane domain-containing protein [Planctomycetota bacterium]